MTEKIRKASHYGELTLGKLSIPCAVLEDGTRVLSERGVTKSLGGKRGGAHWRRKKAEGGGANLPVYLSAANLTPFIDKELQAALSAPIIYKAPSGLQANGVPAEMIPRICEVLLRARDKGALHQTQSHLAVNADMIMRGLAHVGIIALVDEATGYQEVRDRHALEKILEAWIAKELLPWTKRFPDEFYQRMFELKGWAYDPASVRRPKLIGLYTNDIVYERLETGVLDELRQVNPKDERGNRRSKHHQWLTPDIGHPKLRDHLNGVIALMRASANWDNFKRMLNRAYPKKGSTLELPLDD